MTFGKPRDAESVIGPAMVEGRRVSCMATCSTLPGQRICQGGPTPIPSVPRRWESGKVVGEL